MKTENTHIKGCSFSSTAYKKFKEDGRQNIFEEVIDNLMAEGLDIPSDFIEDLPVEEKREFILNCLIPEEGPTINEMFKNIKNSETRSQHLKNSIETIKEFIKVGNQEVKKFGEVYTGLNLVNKILNTLSKDVWSNPDLKWGDFCSGMGNFPLVVIVRLMKGLQEWQPDSEKRYKHIIENMIYVGELQPRNAFIYLCLVDPNDEYDVNLYVGSYLDNGFDEHMKNVWNLSEVNIIVGNPPYLRNTHMDFLIKSFEISTKTIFIHPASWIFRRNNKVNSYKKLIENKINSFTILNGNYYFSAEFGTPLSITFLDKNINRKEIKIKYDTSDNVYFVDSMESLPSGFWEPSPMMMSLVKKYKKISENNNLNNLLIKNSEKIKNKITIPRVCGHSVKRNDKTTFVTNDFYTFFYPNSNLDNINTVNKVIKVNSQKEKINMIEYLKSKIIRFGLYINKISQDAHIKSYLENVPLVDFTKEWDDDKLKNHFNITEKEWEFIESVIPDYY